MTAAAHVPEPARPEADELEPAPEWIGDAIAAERFGSPEEIRGALPPGQVDQFDEAFEGALTAAGKTLHLDQLRHVLRMWRRQALLATTDPDGHRQSLITAADVQRTGQPRPGSVPWSALKADLGL